MNTEPESAKIVARSPQPRLSTAKAIAFSIANLGYGAFYTLNNAILALYLQAFTKNAVVIGLLGSTHSFEGAVIQPLVGSASDRLRTPFGRRRPFMLAAIPISSLLMLLTPICGHMPPTIRLGLIVVCIFLFTVSFNIAQDPYNALMPDITPEPQRGRVTGISMFVFMLGQVVLVFLPKQLGPFQIHTETKFYICAILMLLTTLITCAFVKEPHHPAETVSKTSHLQSIKVALEGLSTLRQARKALFVSLFSGLGIGAVFPFLTVFVKTITKCSDEQAQQMFLYLVGSTALFVMVYGWFVDRFGPRIVLMFGLTLIALASIAGLWVDNLTQIRMVMVLAGLGNAAQFASAYPLLYELVPGEEVGFYTGLQSTALSIANPVTSIITGILVNQGGYRRIFVVCAVCVGASIFVLSLVKRSSALAEVRQREVDTNVARVRKSSAGDTC